MDLDSKRSFASDRIESELRFVVTLGDTAQRLYGNQVPRFCSGSYHQAILNKARRCRHPSFSQRDQKTFAAGRQNRKVGPTSVSE